LRRADTGHHVLALRIDEILAIESILARRGIAAEAYARCRGVAHVAKHHRHDVHGRSPLLRNAFHLAVQDGAVVHPTVKHGTYRTPQLLHRVVGEILAGLVLDGLLEECHETFQLVDGHLIVQSDAPLCLHLLDDGLEGVDIFLVDRLHAQHHVAIHLYEPTVTVVGKTLVAGLLDQSYHHLVVETEVQDGVHHARHGSPRTRPHTHQQRIFGVAKLQPHELLGMLHAVDHTITKQSYDLFLSFLEVLVTYVGGNGKARRHRNPDEIHLRKVCAFATQQVFHVGFSLGFSIAEEINSFFVIHSD